MFVAAGLAAQPGPAAGTGAAANVLGSNADGSEGIVVVVTGAGGLAGGRLVVVTFPMPILADVDAFAAATTTMPGAVAGGAAFAVLNLVVTPYTLPPVGVVFDRIVDMVAGQATRFAITCSGALVPSTTYRFGWGLVT